MIDLVFPCLFGLESVVAFEAKSLGLTDVVSENGRVRAKGELADIVRANVGLRTAERVLVCLAEFDAFSFEDLFQGVKRIDWSAWVGKTDRFPVKGYSLNSKLHSVPDCQSIVKKAIVEKLKDAYHVSWFEETGALYQVQFAIQKDHVMILLDTSGQPLHKRGYREISSAAPIKETIAAGLVDIARYKGRVPLYDPMCGSGTFVIEAAMRVKNIAPGLYRDFPSRLWPQIGSAAWQETREGFFAKVAPPDIKLHGSDIDPKVIAVARENAKKAHVDDIVDFTVRDVKDFAVTGDATIISNPPYGERLLDVDAARALYRVMGSVLPGEGRQCYFISPDEEFETHYGAKADKKRKIYNGMIKCNFYEYFK